MPEPTKSAIEATKEVVNPVVMTVDGKEIVVTPGDVSRTAIVGEFFSTRSAATGVLAAGKWVTIFAIVSQIVQVIWSSGLIQQLVAAFTGDASVPVQPLVPPTMPPRVP